MKFKFYRQTLEKYSYFTTTRSVGAKLFNGDGRTNGQTDRQTDRQTWRNQ